MIPTHLLQVLRGDKQDLKEELSLYVKAELEDDLFAAAAAEAAAQSNSRKSNGDGKKSHLENFHPRFS